MKADIWLCPETDINELQDVRGFAEGFFSFWKVREPFGMIGKGFEIIAHHDVLSLYEEGSILGAEVVNPLGEKITYDFSFPVPVQGGRIPKNSYKKFSEVSISHFFPKPKI